MFFSILFINISALCRAELVNIINSHFNLIKFSKNWNNPGLKTKFSFCGFCLLFSSFSSSSSSSSSFSSSSEKIIVPSKSYITDKTKFSLLLNGVKNGTLTDCNTFWFNK